MEHCATCPTPRRPARLFSTILHMIAVTRQRRKLIHASDRMLDDMGIDRETALYEASRPIWDVPRGWRR